MNKNKIQDQGHTFAPFLSEGEVGYLVSNLADRIYCDYPDGLVICPVLSGASIFAADLVRRINLEILNLTHLKPISVELNFIKYRSYQGTESTNNLVAELPFNSLKIQNKDIVIVEDIVDSGFTVDKLRKNALRLGAKSVRVCTLLFRPRAFKGQQKPEYIGFSLPDNIGFVVGYGMDLDEKYRELPEIYCEYDLEASEKPE